MTGNERPGPLRGRSPVLAAVLGAACISASAILVKLANTGAATTGLLRCALALPLLFTLAAAEQRRLSGGLRRVAPPRQHSGGLRGVAPPRQHSGGLRGVAPPRQHGGRPRSARVRAAGAGLFLSVDLVLWNHAIAEVGAGVATVLGNLQVLFVTVAAWLLWRERPALRFLLALPAVMAGVVLVSGLAGAAQHGNHPVAGIWYGLGTSVAYAFFLLIFRQASGRDGHIAGPLADATAGAAAGCLLLGLVFGGLSFHLSWQSFGWLLTLAITSQTIGWLLITSSLPRLPAAVSSLLLLLQPAASLLLAAVLLGERPTLLQLAGAALVCCGVLVATRRPATRSGAEPGVPAVVAAPPSWRTAADPPARYSQSTSAAARPPASLG